MLNVTDDAWWSSVPNGNEHGGKHVNVTPRGELLLVTSNHGCQNEQCGVSVIVRLWIQIYVAVCDIAHVNASSKGTC